MKVTGANITDEQIRELLSLYPSGSTEAYWCHAALETSPKFPARLHGLREHCARIWNARHGDSK
jgi:hypothetical protein